MQSVKVKGCTLSCTDGMTDEQRVIQVPPYANFVEMEDKKNPDHLSVRIKDVEPL